jgi:hypothetical protein
MLGKCFLQPIDSRPGFYHCALCGWENKTPRDRPPRRNCGKAPNKTHYPLGLRSEEEVQRLIDEHCADCDHFPITEICALDKECWKTTTSEQWRRKARDRRYNCALGLWKANRKSAATTQLRPDGKATLADVTACITTFKRPDSLKRLLASLERHCPVLPVKVEDTNGNLSAGRNRLVAKCATPFILIMEDDFEFTARTDLEPFCQVLNADSTVGAVAGNLELKGKSTHWSYDLRVFRGKGILEQPTSKWMVTEEGAFYRYTDTCYNFLLARREMLEQLPWDNVLALQEHAPWCLRVKQHGYWRIAHCPAVVVRHHIDRPTPEYTQMRNRTDSRAYSQAAYGFAGTSPRPGEIPMRPNIIIGGAGLSNTTTTAKMLMALGWNGHDADDEFAESVSFRTCNRQHMKAMRIDKQLAVEVLRQFRAPWVIKEPKLGHTMSLWLPYLAQYSPFLLYVTKDIELVKASYRRRGEPESQAVYTVFQWDQLSETWPWGSLRLDVSEISRAVSLFDVKRWQGPPTGPWTWLRTIAARMFAANSSAGENGHARQDTRNVIS